MCGLNSTAIQVNTETYVLTHWILNKLWGSYHYFPHFWGGNQGRKKSFNLLKVLKSVTGVWVPSPQYTSLHYSAVLLTITPCTVTLMQQMLLHPRVHRKTAGNTQFCLSCFCLFVCFWNQVSLQPRLALASSEGYDYKHEPPNLAHFPIFKNPLFPEVLYTVH